MKIVHTDGRDIDFIYLCKQLDANLDEIVGGAIQREIFDQYNHLDDINDAVVIYLNDTPIASGGLRPYQNDIAEIKRIFVLQAYRGRGLSKILMSELELLAKKAGYKKLILETGVLLVASLNLYKSIGFTIVENYEPYKNMKESVCMEKILTDI